MSRKNNDFRYHIRKFKFRMFIYCFIAFTVGFFILEMIKLVGNPASALLGALPEIIYFSLALGLFCAVVIWIVMFVLPHGNDRK